MLETLINGIKQWVLSLPKGVVISETPPDDMSVTSYINPYEDAFTEDEIEWVSEELNKKLNTGGHQTNKILMTDENGNVIGVDDIPGVSGDITVVDQLPEISEDAPDVVYLKNDESDEEQDYLFVSYDEVQILTEQEKAQARANIGAAQAPLNVNILWDGNYFEWDAYLWDIKSAILENVPITATLIGPVNNQDTTLITSKVYQADGATGNPEEDRIRFEFEWTNQNLLVFADTWDGAYGSGTGIYTQPMSATSTKYGNIKADPVEETDTIPARISEDGKLYVAPSGNDSSVIIYVTDETETGEFTSTHYNEDFMSLSGNGKDVTVLVTAANHFNDDGYFYERSFTVESLTNSTFTYMKMVDENTVWQYLLSIPSKSMISEIPITLERTELKVDVNEPIIVNVTSDNDGNCTADMTFAEIEAEIKAGKTVIANITGHVYIRDNIKAYYSNYELEMKFYEPWMCVIFSNFDGMHAASIEFQIMDGWVGLYAVPMTASTVQAIPAPETATVGQTIQVTEVDEDGKPIAWEAADFPGGSAGFGWTLSVDFVSEEDVAYIALPMPTEVNEAYAYFVIPAGEGTVTLWARAWAANGALTGSSGECGLGTMPNSETHRSAWFFRFGDKMKALQSLNYNYPINGSHIQYGGRLCDVGGEYFVLSTQYGNGRIPAGTSIKIYTR